MPWPNVRLVSGLRMQIEPDWVAEAIIARGFAEKIPEDILKQEREALKPPIVVEPPVEEKPKKRGK